MSQTDFETWLNFCWLPENDGQPYHVTQGDRGKGTAWGATQASWSAWCAQQGLRVALQDATKDQIEEMIHANYWNAVQADQMWPALMFLVVDFGFVGGPRARFLQQVAGATIDGKIGRETIAAVNNIVNRSDALCTFSALCEDYYRRDVDFGEFGVGWLRRNNQRLNIAANMLAGSNAVA
jgi:lysozyme family protein